MDMKLSWIILQQTLRMSLYMLLGYLLFKKGKINVEGSKMLAGLLLWLIIPSTILDSFCVEFTVERAEAFLVSTLLGGTALAISLAVARVLFPKDGIAQFAAAFSNAGYIGIPLIQASFGAEAVFYLVGLILLLNFFQWTYGTSIIQKELQPNSRAVTQRLRKILLNPIVISAAIGICIFFTGLGGQMPRLIEDCVEGIATMNAPLAMIVLGVYLAQTNVWSLFTDQRLYCISAVRLLLIPLIILAVFFYLPVDNQLKLTILIAIAAPAGANVAVYAQLYDANYTYACKTVTHSTIFSILLLPLFITVTKVFIA